MHARFRAVAVLALSLGGCRTSVSVNTGSAPLQPPAAPSQPPAASREQGVDADGERSARVSPARVLEPGVLLHEMDVPVREHTSRAWVYLPRTPSATRLPCVLIAPAGTRGFHGMPLAEGDRPEHLPWVRAGFAVVAYELDGHLPDGASDEQVVEAVRRYVAAQGGYINAHNTLFHALRRFPAIDPKRVYAVGHSSAATMALYLAETYAPIRACVAFAPVCYLRERLGEDLVRTLDDQVPDFARVINFLDPKSHSGSLLCPTFLFHAADDANVPRAEIDRFLADTPPRNSRIKLVTVPSGGHYDSMIRVGIPGAIGWIRSLESESG